MNSGFDDISSLIQSKPPASNDTDLLEISQFQFPSVQIEQLTKEPYLSYVKLYKEMYGHLKFYRGFIQPSIVERAKIYRALDLCCVNGISIKDIIVFATTEGLIIKCRHIDDECFNSNFNHYISQEDYYVFIPENCDKLDQYNYSYYRRMLNNFTLNEQIPGKTFRMNEHDNVFLFVSLESTDTMESGQRGNSCLEKKWKEYIQGGVLRTYNFSANRLCSVLKTFPWVNRVTFRILPNDIIEITVRSPSIKDFETRITEINRNQPLKLEYVDLEFAILDEYESFGILRILSERIANISQIIPLSGTSRIYYSSDILDDILLILKEYHSTEELPEGSEIFTQENFSEMIKWRQASLIKAPSKNLYSLLDLYRNSKKEDSNSNKVACYDPATRDLLPESFLNDMTVIMEKINSVFMTGFPPKKFEPELITIASESNALIRTISFYIKLGEETNAFWIVPDLRGTEYGKITLEAIRTLVIKWSDHSIFKGSFPETGIAPDGDIHLIFSSIALYIFEQTISNLTLENYPRDIKAQAQHLQEQIYLLKRCS